MTSISNLWKENKELFSNKKLQQIISFIGEGKLKDNNQTCQELRELLDRVPTEVLKMYAEECLTESFTDSGFVLQDIINQIGLRLGFNVRHGLYRGKINGIGYDGLWETKENHNIIIEVKTTDAYRINLNTIANYRKKLSDAKEIDFEKSSILIIVGRKDTGDLEAQIRGSQHAWDIRLISTDALINLLNLKEKLNDAKTSHQINSILRPFEYTRVDKLIDLIFVTAQDLELDDDDEKDNVIPEKNNKKQKKKESPVTFHQECIDKIANKLNINFIKQSRSSYSDKNNTTGVTVAISKSYPVANNRTKYWFAFHPHQREFLKQFNKAHVSYGCGSNKNIFLLDLDLILSNLDNLWTTEKNDKIYWHIVIYEEKGNFKLQLPNKNDYLDLTKYKV